MVALFLIPLLASAHYGSLLPMAVKDTMQARQIQELLLVPGSARDLLRAERWAMALAFLTGLMSVLILLPPCILAFNSGEDMRSLGMMFGGVCFAVGIGSVCSLLGSLTARIPLSRDRVYSTVLLLVVILCPLGLLLAIPLLLGAVFMGGFKRGDPEGFLLWLARQENPGFLAPIAIAWRWWCAVPGRCWRMVFRRRHAPADGAAA